MKTVLSGSQMSSLIGKHEVSEIDIYLHSQMQRFFANVSLFFSYRNERCMAFAEAAILLSFMQRIEEYVVALYDSEFSCCLGY